MSSPRVGELSGGLATGEYHSQRKVGVDRAPYLAEFEFEVTPCAVGPTLPPERTPGEHGHRMGHQPLDQQDHQ